MYCDDARIGNLPGKSAFRQQTGHFERRETAGAEPAESE
jgi:hypothetical protein